jgi:hypothetical protein
VAPVQQPAVVALEALFPDSIQTETQDKQAFFTTAAMGVLAQATFTQVLAVVEQVYTEAAGALLHPLLKALEAAADLEAILGQSRFLPVIANRSETASRPT